MYHGFSLPANPVNPPPSPHAHYTQMLPIQTHLVIFLRGQRQRLDKDQQRMMNLWMQSWEMTCYLNNNTIHAAKWLTLHAPLHTLWLHTILDDITIGLSSFPGSAQLSIAYSTEKQQKARRGLYWKRQKAGRGLGTRLLLDVVMLWSTCTIMLISSSNGNAKSPRPLS